MWFEDVEDKGELFDIGDLVLDLSALAADILRRIQAAPGRWTVNQLAAATGAERKELKAAVSSLIHGGQVTWDRRLPLATVADPRDVDRIVVYYPTLGPDGSFVAPCDRPRP